VVQELRKSLVFKSAFTWFLEPKCASLFFLVQRGALSFWRPKRYWEIDLLWTLALLDALVLLAVVALERGLGEDGATMLPSQVMMALPSRI